MDLYKLTVIFAKSTPNLCKLTLSLTKCAVKHHYQTKKAPSYRRALMIKISLSTYFTKVTLPLYSSGT
jgi:hypothetical protein